MPIRESRRGKDIFHNTSSWPSTERQYTACVCASCAASLRNTQRSPYVRDDEGVKKLCSKCGKLLPINQYYCHRNNKPMAACKSCLATADQEPARKEKIKAHRRKGNLRKYDLTEEQYQSLLEQQNGCCAICGSQTAGRKAAQHFCVDHDHTTGETRGLLCHSCNLAVGHLKDSPGLCHAAANYLECNSHK